MAHGLLPVTQGEVQRGAVVQAMLFQRPHMLRCTAQRFVVVGVHAQNVGGQPATLRIRATGPTGARLLAQHALPLLGEQLLLDLSDSPIRLDAGETVRATLEGNGSSCHVALLGYTEG